MTNAPDISEETIVPFTRSVPGKLVLLSAAIFLLSAAALLVVTGDMRLYVWGIGLPAAITITFVAIGLGMGKYTKETMFSVCVLPPALWGFIYLVGEFEYVQASNWGYGVGALGVLVVLYALRPALPES